MLEYPVEPLPADIRATVGPGPAPEDYEAIMSIFESSEAEMTALRRPMTPFIVKIDNVAEDEVVWTVLSFHGALSPEFTGDWFDGRWIARRARQLWDGRTIVDWADSVRCEDFVDRLARVVALHPPQIEAPSRDGIARDTAKTTIIPEREFTLWTTWAPDHDLRFGGDTESDVGQWAISLAIALQPCWQSTEPHRR